MIGKTILPLECVTIFGIFRLGRSPIFPISDSFPPSALSSDAVLRGSVGRLRQPQHPHHVRHVPGADLQADRLQQGPLPKGDNPVSWAWGQKTFTGLCCQSEWAKIWIWWSWRSSWRMGLCQDPPWWKHQERLRSKGKRSTKHCTTSMPKLLR